MVSRYRFPRSVILLVIMMVFSLTLVGQTDNRLHIGGADWDYDGLYVEYQDFYRLAAEEPGKSPADIDSLEASDDVEVSRSLTDEPGSTVEAAPGVHKVPVSSALGTEEEMLDSPEKADGVFAESEEEEVAVTEGEAEAPSLSDAEGAQALPVELAVEIPVETPEEAPEETISAAAEVAVAESVEAAIEEPVEKTPEPAPKRSPIHVHTVKSGETLWDIAQAYGITVDTILSANDISNSNRIRVGQELQILTVQGVLHPVAVGESLWEIARRYDVSIDAIAAANDISDPSRIQPRDRLVIPGATSLRPRDVLVVNGQLQKAFDWPTRGRISSPFGPRWGRMHNGIDIAVPTGTPIRAAANGTVSFAGWNGGYGYLVTIDHGNNIETRYAHNSRLPVKAGTRVERGQIVAYSGNTGNSTGPHLHFEIRHRGTPVDPMRFLR